jgi:beta-alanine--pyruvate transaminase
MAAGLATMDVYEDEKLFDNAKELSPFWENSWHAVS